MLAVWRMVGRGEIVDVDAGTTNWSIDWQAIQTLLMVEHDTVTRDPADEILDALMAIRAELMRPATDRLSEHPLD